MDLLQRFALGEIDAFETLVRQFQGEIYAWVVRIVRDPGIAEDLTVETLWRIYRARQQFRPDGSFAAWSRRIATNLAPKSTRGWSRHCYGIIANHQVTVTHAARVDSDKYLTIAGRGYSTLFNLEPAFGLFQNSRSHRSKQLASHERSR